MKEKLKIKPSDELSGYASGMLMMAFFTSIWTVIAYGGLKESLYKYALILFLILVVIIASYAFRFLKESKRYSDENGKFVAEVDKKSDKRYMWLCIGEGLGIFIGINIVINLGYPDLVIPVIALVVGLHFFPLGWLFKRKQDYYIGTWSTIIAICGIVFSIYGLTSHSFVVTIIGVGMAMATSVYGFSMLIRGLQVPIAQGLSSK
ncbi:hypothetical protein [Pedobacter sp. ASV28]|uniref:hypothetical protein n=1 Tax=Pedobacter sp. ASV28 TaxID=2795123 RepID=UPI0018ED6D49|nr:hypothetical protein [Pedobacter sp. ASV28]